MWDGRGILKGVELIPEEELGRPRIDILVNASGLYRDVFPLQIGLIDDAVQLVIDEKEGRFENFARLHALQNRALFVEKGFSEKEAEEMSRYRIFGAPNQGYGTGLGEAIPASGGWEDDEKLTDLYINRLNYAYGRNVWGKQSREAFTEALKGTDVIIHSRASNIFGVLDNDDVYQYLGGMSMAVRNLTGEEPDLVISDNRDPSAAGKLVNFARFMGVEMRGRYFNPEWITGMKEHGYSGAEKMAKFVENLWGFQVTTPKEVTKEMWEQATAVYVDDKYGMELKEFFEKNCPTALQSITARILEVDRKGYQEFDEETLRKLSAEYIESVAEQGLVCSANVCDNIELSRFAADMLSTPGLVSPTVMEKFRDRVKEITGKEVTMPDWVKASEKVRKTAGVAEGSDVKNSKNDRTEEVKGYEMKEEAAEAAENISSPGTIFTAFIIVVIIVAAVGRGIWKAMRASGQ